MKTLGIRNNNPCNIRFNKLNHWLGQIGEYKGFCKFSSMDFGVRAVLCILRTYRYQYGLDTVRKIISRFAPSSENNTEFYIDFVVKTCNTFGFKITADSSLNFDFFDFKGVGVLHYIVLAMCYMESRFVLDDAQFERSLKLLHF